MGKQMQPPSPASAGPCEHDFEFTATVYWIDRTQRLPGSDACVRKYADRYHCRRCLWTTLINTRELGNSYGKPAEGTLPR